METNYDANLSIEQGIQLAVKVINTALQRDSASGNGINVVVVSAEGVKKVMTKELVAKL